MNPQQLSGLLVPLVFVVIFYFLLIKPQQKREKSLKDMRENLKVGNEVVTIGGIVGKIIKVNEESVTIEIGADKTKLVFEKWGIAKVKS